MSGDAGDAVTAGDAMTAGARPLRSNFEPGTNRWAMRRAGLSDSVAVITDGQLSGLVNNGISVAEVSPDGAAGGPLGLVKDGDVISIDIDARTIDLDVPADELARRRAELPDLVPPQGCGWLSLYARLVRPLGQGATLGGVR